MVTCSVPGCASTRRKKSQKCTFHVFPLDAVVREKWIRMVHREGWVPKKYSVVCSKHFEKNCFSESTEQRVKLRQGSVPTLFMPEDITPLHSGRINMKSAENWSLKQLIKEPGQSVFEGTMSEDATAIQEVKKEMSSECRTCLQQLNSDEDLYYIFQSWVPPWEGVENTIAEALQRIANVQLSDMDPHSKVICGVCCQKLHMACLFANLAQQSDYELWQRNPINSDTSIDKKWPKPIQIDKNVPFDEQKEIKQEDLSDEEYSYDGLQTSRNDGDKMEIKIEPVELIPQHEIPVELNGHYEEMSPDALTSEFSVNGDDSSQEHYNVMVKEEPMSDSESVGTDMSLDCMLCTKVFNSVSGLKAHVIAYHSYKSVRRKAANETSPAKRQKHEHVCATCRRSFVTPTDLMVHETCHNKSVCYGCNEKFDSFELVMQHRLTCKAVNNREQVPVKTLEDVQRVNDKKKERQQRYRDQNREKLRQREADRRKRKHNSEIIAEPSYSKINRTEFNNESMTDDNSQDTEGTQILSGRENEAEEKKSGLQKKRERQQRYREQNREKLKQRQAERRKRQQNPEVVAETSTSSNMESLEVVSEEITDDEITNSLSEAGLEETLNRLAETTERSQRSSSNNSEEGTNEQLKCTLCGESFTDNYYMNIHLEIHHPASTNAVANDEEMEVEALESLFSERA